MKYAIVTFGCRVNQGDSHGLEEELQASGAMPAAARDADLVVVNTCSVTASSDQGARQTIRRIARENPSARIVVTGCYATREADAVRGLPHVAAVVSNGDKPQLLQIVRGSAPTTAERYGTGEGSCGAALEPGFAGRTAYTLRVQTGCAEPCSYCIIPSTRGAPRSTALEQVLGELSRVLHAGFKEVVLTGVHLGSYGRDLAPQPSLLELLERVGDSAARFDARIRISSLEPMDCTPAIVRLVATGGPFAAHFHLPLQHASDRMLRLMRRPYTLRDYSDLVNNIRQLIPNASIGSDIIVGFPDERDGDAALLEEYLAGSPLTHLHVFPYSDRPGTPAAAMAGKVAGDVVRARGARVRAIGEVLSQRFRRGQIGAVLRGLSIDDGRTVVTDNYLKLRIPQGHARNEWVPVRVSSEHDGEPLGRRALLPLDDQLPASGANVAAATLSN